MKKYIVLIISILGIVIITITNFPYELMGIYLLSPTFYYAGKSLTYQE